MTLNRCLGINKDGSACKARAQRDSAYCLAHDPERVTDLADWRRRGGQASSNKKRALRRLAVLEPVTVTDVQAIMAGVLLDLLEGKLETGIANSAATVARAFASLAAAGDLEGRLRQLEERAGLREVG